MIKVEEVRKGDTITVTWTSRDVKHTVTGVAHHQDSDGDWCSGDDVHLTNMLRPQQDIRLDSRLPPTEAGSVLLSATLKSGRTAGPLFLSVDGGYWLLLTDYPKWVTTEEIVDFTLGKVVAAD